MADRGHWIVRDATPSDLEGIAALLDEISEMHVAAIPELFRPSDARAQAEWMLGEVVKSPLAVLLVAESEGRVVGLVDFEERSAEDRPLLTPRRYVKIGTLVVAASHRGRGIGGDLMRRAHDWAAAQGLSEAELSVYEFNRGAIRLYEGLGYATRARRMVRKLAQAETPSQGNEVDRE